jgi:uncharacterized iron-regulated protein
MIRALAVALLGLTVSCAAAPVEPPSTGHALEGTIWDVAAGRQITREALAERLSEADVAILGEIHDNASHHLRQAWLIETLEPAGVAFEMVPEASEEGVAVFRDTGGTLGEIGPAIGWERLGWPDWALYLPVFEAVGNAYLAGGGVSRTAIRAAFQDGSALAFGTGADAYGLDAPLPAALQRDAEAEMIAAHCDRLPASAAASMVEAQRLRDASFAHAVRRAMAAGGGSAVLVTGNGHARTDRGVPLYLAASDPDLAVLSLGQVEVDPARPGFADYGTGTLPYDFVWFSAPAVRDDPCAAFE